MTTSTVVGTYTWLQNFTSAIRMHQQRQATKFHHGEMSQLSMNHPWQGHVVQRAAPDGALVPDHVLKAPNSRQRRRR